MKRTLAALATLAILSPSLSWGMQTVRYVMYSGSTGSSGITSNIIPLGQEDLAAVQVVLTGSTGGTLQLNASVDYNPNLGIAGTWTIIGGSSVNVNGAGNTMYNLADIGYPFLEVQYIQSTGVGTITATAFGKGP